MDRVVIPRRKSVCALTFHGWWICTVSMKGGKKLVPIIPRWLTTPFTDLWNKFVCAIRGHDTTLRSVTEAHKAGQFPCCMCCKMLNVSLTT